MSPTSNEHPQAEADASQAPAFSVPPPADSTLTDSWVTIRKRKYVILGCALLGMVYGWYKASTQPRLYDASSTIEIHVGASNQYKISPTGNSVSESTSITTQVAILKSDSLMLAVARDLNLANNPDFMGPSTTFRNVDDPVVRQVVVSALQGDVSVNAIPRTDLVNIHCSSGNPKLSADIVNKVVAEYILRSFQSRADATKRVSEFFSNQLTDLKQEVLNSQQQMLDLQKRLGVLGFDPSLNEITTNLADLSHAAQTAELARIEAETKYRELASMNRPTLDIATDNLKANTIAALRAQLESAQTQLAQADVLQGRNNPKEKVLRREIESLKQQITAEEDRAVADAKQAYLAAKAQEDQTKSVLEAKQNDAYKLRDDLLAYNLQQREFEANRTLYDGLNQRLRTAGVESGLESTEIDIVDPALPPLGPTLKPRSTIMIVDTTVMAVFGIILAFLLDSLDQGLRTVAEIESVSGLPSLALVPRGRRSGAEGSGNSVVLRNIGLLANPKSQFAEAFRALRTSLLLSVAGGEPKVILLTSATPSEGKTTVSVNLACVLAQRNVRVLLIDADLRRPTVHHRFGLNGKVGLTSVLTGSVPLEQALQRVPEVPQLDILVSGPVPPFPTEMLSSQTMHELLEKCRGIYTHIVMDSPPLLSVTDSVVLAREANAVVMIVRHGKSSKHALRRGRDLLQRSGSRLTGIVLNAVDLSSPEYYSYYGYYGYTAYSAAGVDSAGWESQGGDATTARKDGGDR